MADMNRDHKRDLRNLRWAGLLTFLLGLLLGLAQSDAPTVRIASHPTLGDILTDPDGRTLYTFARDEEGRLECTGGCAVNWPPYLLTGLLVAPEGLPGELGTVTRPADEEANLEAAAEQITYRGRPLYYWSRDKEPGDATGHGIGDLWEVARP